MIETEQYKDDTTDAMTMTMVKNDSTKKIQEKQ
jgi:hypothetical protein